MFNIPMEMFMGGGQQRQVEATEWPKTENSEVSPEFDWLVNTEWKGNSARYLLMRDGNVESDRKECAEEGQCLWAANNGKLLLNTPSLKVIRFIINGLDKCDQKKLEAKDLAELAKITLSSEKVGKGNKRAELKFSKVPTAAEDDKIPSRDLYEILDIGEDADSAAVKSKYRRLSVQNHPDKGGDPEVFNEIREAYEVLSDAEKRRYYSIGGMQLVRNVEMGWKEIEGQIAQLDQQLSQVPKHHPQYHAFKAQIDAQKPDKHTAKSTIEQNLKSDDLDVLVPCSAEELYNGSPQKRFEFKRLTICRGCRADPQRPQCKDCGRCPPEKVKVPKYANTMFGKQVVGHKEKEQESRERCREEIVPMTFKVPVGAQDGHSLGSSRDLGHQTSGKLPGKVVFRVQRGSAADVYRIAIDDLYTVLRVSLAQALFGFSISWKHLGKETVTVTGSPVTKPGEVVKLPRKGLVSKSGSRGDLYVRVEVDMPSVEASAQELVLKKPAADDTARLEREEPLNVEDGAAWRRWAERDQAVTAKKEKSGRSEL